MFQERRHFGVLKLKDKPSEFHISQIEYSLEMGVGGGRGEARERKAPHLVEVNGIVVTALLGL